MERELRHQMNGEIINKITNNLYSYSYTDEEPAEGVIIIRSGDFKATFDLEMEVSKDKDGIIDSCVIRPRMRKEKTT